MRAIEYDDEFLQKISDGVDLLEYIGKNTPLEKKGKEYFGECSRHIDKTPSLSITPDKNVYYCFSCGSGDGIIQYLSDYENMSFDVAVQKACRLSGTDISKQCISPTVRLLKKVRQMRQKSKVQEHEVLSEDVLQKYSKEPISEWIAEGIRAEELDLFDIRLDKRSNRIVYPVRDIDGRLINIKGRTRFENYKEMRLAKYMNYYPIGNMDYFQSLNLTLPYILKKNEVIIFEGVKSVMKCYGWGYKNCVSAEKHTLTEEQIRLLVNLRVNVVFAYDSDVSYKTSDAKNTIQKLLRFTNVSAILDPDNLLGGVEGKNSPADKGRQVFEELYEKRKRMI